MLQTIVFLVFCCLGMFLYGRAIYRQCLNKRKDPVYAKKTVLNISVRFILMLLMMAIVSFVNRNFKMPTSILYVLIAAFVLLFIRLIWKIREIMQDE